MKNDVVTERTVSDAETKEANNFITTKTENISLKNRKMARAKKSKTPFFNY